tara:strand:+ start:295 stop:420 length:126 start_codon:yes stop_codon:yes gene_type:complete
MKKNSFCIAYLKIDNIEIILKIAGLLSIKYLIIIPINENFK